MQKLDWESAPETIQTEVLFDFEEAGLKGQWQRLSTPEGLSVEGAFYEASDKNGEVVVFHPGLPGDGVVRFEEEHLKPLLDAGYDVFVARHNGLKVQPENEKLVHNKTLSAKGGAISGDPLTWLGEPRVTMAYFAQLGKPIILITHSFSGLSAANSFVEMAQENPDANPATMVKKWILASGSVWTPDEDGVLDPERALSQNDLKEYCEYFAQIYQLSSANGAQKLFSKMMEATQTVAEGIGQALPANLDIIGVYPVADRLVSPEIGLAFFNKLPRGVLLLDKSPAKDGPADPHDFAQAQPLDLLRVIRMKSSPNKHVFDINKPKL